VSSIAYRIAAQWMEVAYPSVKTDEFSLPYYDELNSRVEQLYNKLPLKAKKILYQCELHFCSRDTLAKVVEEDISILGLCRPADKKIWYNIERFVVPGESLDMSNFDNLVYHEIGHYLVHNFSEREKAFYYKKFGIEPQTAGEPEADGFAAYMQGVAPYNVQEFWAWWVVV
jgi:hypothetical protein